MIDYDKEEFARIKKSAEYIKKNADVLVVIGNKENIERFKIECAEDSDE